MSLEVQGTSIRKTPANNNDEEEDEGFVSSRVKKFYRARQESERNRKMSTGSDEAVYVSDAETEHVLDATSSYASLFVPEDKLLTETLLDFSALDLPFVDVEQMVSSKVTATPLCPWAAEKTESEQVKRQQKKSRSFVGRNEERPAFGAKRRCKTAMANSRHMVHGQELWKASINASSGHYILDNGAYRETKLTPRNCYSETELRKSDTQLPSQTNALPSGAQDMNRSNGPVIYQETWQDRLCRLQLSHAQNQSSPTGVEGMAISCKNMPTLNDLPPIFQQTIPIYPLYTDAVSGSSNVVPRAFHRGAGGAVQRDRRHPRTSKPRFPSTAHRDLVIHESFVQTNRNLIGANLSKCETKVNNRLPNEFHARTTPKADPINFVQTSALHPNDKARITYKVTADTCVPLCSKSTPDVPKAAMNTHVPTRPTPAAKAAISPAPPLASNGNGSFPNLVSGRAMRVKQTNKRVL